MKLRRSMVLTSAALLGAPAVVSPLLLAPGRALAQVADDDYDDVEGPFPVGRRLFGTEPAQGPEEDRARMILSAAPEGKTLLETAKYFEQLTEKNADGHLYNAQWPKRWNPVIMGFYQSTTLEPSYTYRKGDTIDWCAAFLNWCLRRGGYESTKSAMSGSFRLGKGLGKPTTDPKPGDIIVFKKADPDQAKVGFGHVGIFLEKVPNGFRVLGGNQRNGKRYSSVNTTIFPEKSESLVFDSFRAFSSIKKLPAAAAASAPAKKKP